MRPLPTLISTVVLGLLLASCDGHLLDNAPTPLPLYLAMSAADLATCDSVQVSGVIPNLSDYQTNPGVYHLDTKAASYAKTPLTSDELIVGASGTPATLVVKRPGTYAVPYSSTFRYTWTLHLTCAKTATSNDVTLSGAFKNVNRAAVITLTTTGTGQIKAALQEYSSTATPEQLDLP